MGKIKKGVIVNFSIFMGVLAIVLFILTVGEIISQETIASVIIAEFFVKLL